MNMTMQERIYWNSLSYGKVTKIQISKMQLRAIIMILAIAIPIIFPVPLAAVICKYIKTGVTLQW